MPRGVMEVEEATRAAEARALAEVIAKDLERSGCSKCLISTALRLAANKVERAAPGRKAWQHNVAITSGSNDPEARVARHRVSLEG